MKVFHALRALARPASAGLCPRSSSPRRGLPRPTMSATGTSPRKSAAFPSTTTGPLQDKDWLYGAGRRQGRQPQA